MREGDELAWVDDPRLRVAIEGVARAGRMATITMRIARGMRAPGAPTVGATLELVPGLPDWGRIGRRRGQIKERVRTMPWTHDGRGVPTCRPRRSAPHDPLAAVEALR